MSLIELLLLSVALAMDAFAVSLTNGMCVKNMHLKNSVLVALSFGVFQAAMPIIGFYAGSLFYQQIQALDHWIALILLSFLGIKMIAEGVRHHSGETCDVTVMTFKLGLTQALSTSIDALVVGISLSAVGANIWFSVLIIGLITFVLCFFAVFLGKKTGSLLNNKAEIFGGLILIGIGVKIFISHVW